MIRRVDIEFAGDSADSAVSCEGENVVIQLVADALPLKILAHDDTVNIEELIEAFGEPDIVAAVVICAFAKCSKNPAIFPSTSITRWYAASACNVSSRANVSGLRKCTDSSFK